MLILARYLFFVNVLRSILAEEFLSSKDKYEQEAKDHTAKTAAKSFTDKEQVRFPTYIEDSLTLRMYLKIAANILHRYEKQIYKVDNVFGCVFVSSWNLIED